VNPGVRQFRSAHFERKELTFLNALPQKQVIVHQLCTKIRAPFYRVEHSWYPTGWHKYLHELRDKDLRPTLQTSYGIRLPLQS